MEGEQITLSNKSKKSGVDAISILVVDDDTTCLSIVAAILKKFKYEVVTVKHANDALCTLRIKGGAFDLVVSDVHMPDMNGFELQQAIAKEFNLPVVLMSADEKEGVALKGLESGAAFFIYKPVSPDDVRDLWQFAAMKKKSGVVINEEKDNSKETISVSASTVNEDQEERVITNKESKRKSPQKQRSSDDQTQKKPKVIWTNSLHNRFLEAIRSIGLDRAVPKKILEVMNVPGLTRENVASHLQKYRIFLRRVSDASYKIQYSADKGFNRNLFRSTLESSSSTIPSTLMLNRFNKFPYQKPGQLLPTNPEASSSTLISGFGQSRLLSSKGNTGLKLNMIGNTNPINQNDSPYVQLSHNNLQTIARPSIQGHISNISLEDLSSALSASFDAPLFSPTKINPITSCDNVSSYENAGTSSSFAFQTNYVGYSISNIKNLAESQQDDQRHEGWSSRRGMINLGGEELDENNGNVDDQLGQHNDNSFVVGNINGVGEQVSDVIAGYSMMLPSNLPCGGNVNESVYSPMFDMSEFDAFSAQQPLEEGDFNTSLTGQVNIQNQIQQDGGENFSISNVYGGPGYWRNYVPSFDQAQRCNQGLVKPQEFGTSSQTNPTILAPTNEQQACENLTNSLGYGTCSQLLSKTLVSPIEPRDDDDFLESLLAPFGEDQTLEGI